MARGSLGLNGGRDANAYDLLRLFAAFTVAVFHIAYWSGHQLLWVSVSPGQGSSVWFYDGVPLFFILSGMLVYRSAQRCIETGRPIRDYFGNRFLRVWPAVGAYVVVAGTLAVLTGAVVGLWPLVSWAVLTSLFLTITNSASVFLDQANGALWTLPVEVSFYVLVPGFAWLALRIGLRAVLILLYPVAIAGVALGALHEHGTLVGGGWEYIDKSLVQYLWFFVLGMTLLALDKRLPLRTDLAIACGAAYFLGRMLFDTPAVEAVGNLPAVAIGAIPLAYLAAFLGTRLTSASKALRGRDLSYGLYVWHMFVVSLAVFLAEKWDAPVLSNPYVILAIAVGAAMLSWHFVEHPALRKKRFSSRGKTVRVSPSAPPAPTLAPEPALTPEPEYL